MLESFLNFRELNQRPYLSFLWGFVVTVVAVIIALKVDFRMVAGGSSVNLTGLFALMFALMPSAYIMTALIRKEEMLEEKFIRRHYSGRFWERHRKDILIFLYFFGGATLAYAVCTMLLPQDTFQAQISSICALRPELSVCNGGLTGAATMAEQRFQTIFSNNIWVLVFSFVIAFIFGAGSAFIILWNAGILGIYIGLISRHILDIPVQSVRFLPHGIPEIAGYVCAGLAGSLISAAIIRKANSEILKKVTADGLKVLALGVVFVVVGALIEAYL